MDTHREPDVYDAHYHFWDRLSCSTGKSKEKGSFPGAHFHTASDWIALAGVCSRDFVKHKGHPDVLRHCRYCVTAGEERYKSAAVCDYRNDFFCYCADRRQVPGWWL